MIAVVWEHFKKLHHQENCSLQRVIDLAIIHNWSYWKKWWSSSKNRSSFISYIFKYTRHSPIAIMVSLVVVGIQYENVVSIHYLKIINKSCKDVSHPINVHLPNNILICSANMDMKEIRTTNINEQKSASHRHTWCIIKNNWISTHYTLIEWGLEGKSINMSHKFVKMSCREQ